MILWLYGAAGAGKSAIAHSLAEICEKQGCLLATFFFWKTAAERNNITRFIATVAYQVARAIPASYKHIEAAVDDNPMIFHQSVDFQLAKLIIEPLWRLHSTGFDFKSSPFIIIIDGLDECQGINIQSGLVNSLAAAFSHSPLRIRILIASQPEVYLRSTFNSSTLRPHLSQLALSDEYSAEEDICRYLKDSFSKIKREHPLVSYIPSPWPSANILRELAWKSSGQFDPNKLPHHRLDVIRSLRPPKGEKNMPYAELNSLYHHVLSNVDDMESVKQVLGVLLILNRMLKRSNSEGQPICIYTTHQMDSFLLWEPGETKACLSQLASLIECHAVGYISILHASLSDFLLDSSRSHHFYLCRESILGDFTALGLHHMRQQAPSEDGRPSILTEVFPCVLIHITSYFRFCALPRADRRLYLCWPILHPSTPRGTEPTIISNSLWSL